MSDAAMSDGAIDAIRLSPLDNVATVLRPVAPGELIRVRCAEDVAPVLAREAIPLCHKISLAAIPPGAPVTKYGQKIGEAFADVGEGCHVHVHNMRSARARAPA